MSQYKDKVPLDKLLKKDNNNKRIGIPRSINHLVINSVNVIDGIKLLVTEMLKCQRCGYEFFPKSTYEGQVKDYRLCPKCKTPYWKKEKVRMFEVTKHRLKKE